MEIRKTQNAAPRFPWHIFIAVFCIFFLGLSVSAFADQYNFYFTKPKHKVKKKEARVQSPESDEGTEEDGNDEDDPTKPDAAASKGEATPTEPKTADIPTERHQTLKYPGQVPIIINNTNTVGVPAQAPPAAPVVPETKTAPAEETKLVPPTQKESQVTLVVPKDSDKSPWKVRLTAMVLFDDVVYNSSRYSHYSYTSRDATWGGLIALGYDITKIFGFNVYGGARYIPSDAKPDYLLGGELELLPLRIPIRDSWDLVQLGVLAGASTAFASSGTLGSFHVGTRFNLNFGRYFGLTAALRTNFSYAMLEGGVMARL